MTEGKFCQVGSTADGFIDMLDLNGHVRFSIGRGPTLTLINEDVQIVIDFLKKCVKP